jgi:uncharacterized LabA/DUF88 family protein
MRRVVLIDGENLVYGIRHLLGNKDNKAARSVAGNFNFRGLIEELLADNLPTEVLWFGARLRLYDQSPEIKQKSSVAIHNQAKFVNLIQKQKITFIKVGYLRARESDPCEKCGHKTWKLAEKGVDVGLAVRMVQEADKNTELVVISADTDLLPAFQASSKLGAKLMHIGYETSPIYALTKVSDKTRTITLPLAQKYKA